MPTKTQLSKTRFMKLYAGAVNEGSRTTVAPHSSRETRMPCFFVKPEKTAEIGRVGYGQSTVTLWPFRQR
jgi:hypothetical protein